MLTEISGHVSFPNGLMRINLTGLTDWQVPCIRSVPSVIPPSLQIYALHNAGIDGGSAVYHLSIPHIDTGGDNLALVAVECPISSVWQPVPARLATAPQHNQVPRCPALPAFFALVHLVIAGVMQRYSTVPGQETLPGVARSAAR